MSKELEALERISIRCHSKSDGYTYIDDDLFTIKQALQQKITWKHIHNTKVRVPLIQIISGKTQEEKYQIIEDIYYTWEEKKEALEDKNNELEQENAKLKTKTQEQEKVLEIIKNYIKVGIDYGNNKNVSVAVVAIKTDDNKLYVIDQATKEISPKHFKELELLKKVF